MAKCVLVSGGAGFIGSHVTVELIEAGYDVVVADNMSNCDMTCFEGVQKIIGRKLPFEKVDFCDAAATDKLFSDYKIDAVIHFAAFKAVGESVEKPVMYYKNNLGSFLNVLEAASAHGCHNVLFSSSATVYGEPDKVPVTEETPRKPATSPYGATKQMCEDILNDVVKATAGTEGEIRGILLRYFNPIRARSSANFPAAFPTTSSRSSPRPPSARGPASASSATIIPPLTVPVSGTTSTSSTLPRRTSTPSAGCSTARWKRAARCTTSAPAARSPFWSS